MAAGAAPIFSNIYRLVDNLFLTLFGGIRPDYYPYNMNAAEHGVAVLVWGVIWVYVWRYVRSQTVTPSLPVHTINLTIRRLYLLIFSLAGLVMVSWGSLGLIQTLMQMGTGTIWRTPVANYSAQLLVGAAIWVGHWLILQKNFAAGTPAEERSVLRKVYLYLAVFIFSVMALTSGTLLLKRLFEPVLGAPPVDEPLLSQLSAVVPMLVVGVVFWAYHWSVVKQDAAQAPDIPRQATVRRIYAYLVAAVGLGATLTGIGGLLTVLVEMLTGSSTVGLDYYRESVALFASMTLVGVPVWWLPWRAVQTRATLPPSGDDIRDEGSAARRSLVRKIYLYFFVFMASLAIFGSAGWFVFHILTALLGADLPGDFITQVLDAFVISLLAVGVWLYHGWAIRRDGQLAEQDEARQMADIEVVVIDGDEGQLGKAIVDKLRHDLPGIHLRPVGTTPQAAAAMAGNSFSAGDFDTPYYIVGSWKTLASGDVALPLAKSTATKFAVPVAGDNWIWAGLKPKSAEDYAEQISRGVKQAIEGEEINFNHGVDVATIAGIVVGGIVFLCIAGSLLGVAGSAF